MTAPIIIYRPVLLVQPLTDAGVDDGAAVDVSCDMESVELGVDTPITSVSNFCGTYSVPDDPEISATLNVIMNADTSANWAPLVGKKVRFELFDRSSQNVVGGKFRQWDSQVMLNPALYGNTTPGEARTVSFDVPVTSEVTEGTVV